MKRGVDACQGMQVQFLCLISFAKSGSPTGDMTQKKENKVKKRGRHDTNTNNFIRAPDKGTPT